MLKHTEDFQPELAAEVRRLLAKFSPSDKPLTTREAADLTGVSHATVAKMLRGIPVGRFATQKLAERLGGEVGLLFSLSGYAVDSAANDRRSTPERSELEHPAITPLMQLRSVYPLTRFPCREVTSSSGMAAYVESWSRGVRVEGTVLEPNYHHGDVLLIQEDVARLDGRSFLVLHDGEFETGFFIQVGNREYQLNADGTQLNALSGNFKFVGKIVGCLRENEPLW